MHFNLTLKFSFIFPCKILIKVIQANIIHTTDTVGTLSSFTVVKFQARFLQQVDGTNIKDWGNFCMYTWIWIYQKKPTPSTVKSFTTWKIFSKNVNSFNIRLYLRFRSFHFKTFIILFLRFFLSGLCLRKIKQAFCAPSAGSSVSINFL